VTFILGNKAGGKKNLLSALYFITIGHPEAIYFSQEKQRLRKNSFRPETLNFFYELNRRTY